MYINFNLVGLINYCRTVMNVPSNAVISNNSNSKNEEGVGDATDAEGQDGPQPSTSTCNGKNVLQASNYDATKARKSRKRAETEVWQDKILRCLEPVDAAQAETPKKRLHRPGSSNIGYADEGEFV